ncbi:MAG: LCP family protein [Lachnospiraceae bacterium]|nr:LCP family protein [Lachnospiraceae bacterium]
MDKKQWVKKLPLFIVEIIVLIIAIGFLYVTLRTTGEVQKTNVDETKIVVNEVVKEQVKETEEKGVENKYTGVYNVAFFGVDARDGSLGKGNRSDTIMICSVDMDKHEVRLVSIYRDTYLNIGNDSYRKCNVAYALGGPEQALSMINMNTDLYVTDYVTVGFEGVMRAVDALGGVEINVTEEEIQHLNNYQISMVGESEDGKTFTADEGVDYIPVTEPGLQTLNGLQATAYCRIRYIGNDFARTERQRNVIIAMLEKAKTASVGNLTEAVNSVLPHVSTSVDIEDMLDVLGMIGDFKVTVSEGFPFEGMRNGGTIGSEGSCVVATSLEDNVVKLHELLFADEAYEPSEELKSFSQQIVTDTQDYLQY